MLRNRLFNTLIATALMLVVALTAREAFATAMVVSRPNEIACDSLPSRYSIHAKPLNQTGMSVLYTEDGPVGVDGGLKELMSAHRNCSR